MYLTRMELNPARRGFRHLTTNPHRMHAAVEAAFPRSLEAGRKLWRLDAAPSGTFLFVQSPQEPDLTHLAEQAGWPARPDWSTRSMDPLWQQIRDGQTWSFRLAANPVRSGRRGPGADTKRLGHVTAGQQLQWLLDRSPGWGFTVPVVLGEEPDVVLKGRSVTRFRRGQDRQVTMAVAVYEGNLRITDSKRLRDSIEAGIGHGKAYGCGLLTLARPLQT